MSGFKADEVSKFDKDDKVTVKNDWRKIKLRGSDLLDLSGEKKCAIDASPSIHSKCQRVLYETQK